MRTHDVWVILIFSGVVGGCWFWFLRNNRHLNRIADEVVRGQRFTSVNSPGPAAVAMLR